MRKLAANYIFPVHRPPVKNGIIHIDDDGKIVQVEGQTLDAGEQAGVEFYNGALVPGFVDTFFEPELYAGETTIPHLRSYAEYLGVLHNMQLPALDGARFRAILRETYDQGVQAAATVLHKHSSLPALDFPLRIKPYIQFGPFLQSPFSHFEDAVAQAARLPEAVPTPGGPLMVEPKEQKAYSDYLARQKQTALMWHKTSADSEMLVRYKTGSLLRAARKIGLNTTNFKTHTEGLTDLLRQEFAPDVPLILAGNTYCTQEDLQLDAERRVFRAINTTFSRRTEQKVPELTQFMQAGTQNTLFSAPRILQTPAGMLHELISISRQFPNLQFADLLKWATLNGAEALGMENELGSLEPHKKPGVLWLQYFDFQTMQPTPQTRVKRLV